MLHGIDVSAVGQGPLFPWPAYKGRVQFALAKVSEGTGFTDPDAARNIAMMRAEGITPGGYHLLHAGQGGYKQARVFLEHARAAGLGPGSLLALDAEDYGLDGGAPSRMNTVAHIFAAAVREIAGAWPLAYTEISLAPHLTLLDECPLWLANPSRQPVKRIGAWPQVSFEQTGQRGVDTDVFYGNAAQLAQLAAVKEW